MGLLASSQLVHRAKPPRPSLLPFPHHQSHQLPPRRHHAKDLFHGTDLMQQASGEAKVENKGNRVEIEAKLDGLEDATNSVSNTSLTCSGPSPRKDAPSTSVKCK